MKFEASLVNTFLVSPDRASAEGMSVAPVTEKLSFPKMGKFVVVLPPGSTEIIYISTASHAKGS